MSKAGALNWPKTSGRNRHHPHLHAQADGPSRAKAAIAASIAEFGATSVKDMGKVMATLKERFAGQMDFGKASGQVKEALTPK